MLLVQPLISYEFPKPKAQIHTAIQDGKYAGNMCIRQSIANQRLAPHRTMTTIGLCNLARYIAQRFFRVDFISALLGNYYEFFYAVKMCFKSNMFFIRLGYCL